MIRALSPSVRTAPGFSNVYPEVVGGDPITIEGGIKFNDLESITADTAASTF